MALAQRTLLPVLLWMFGCAHPPAQSSAVADLPLPSAQAPERALTPPPPPPPTPDVEALLGRMSVEQKVGQVLMVGFAGLELDDEIRELVKGRQVGGVCLFKRNIASARQVSQLNDALWHLLSDTVPPFIAVDQEGGNVVRVMDGTVVLPGNMALGATHSPQLAYQAGRAQGEDLKRLGFNMNLAPVLDVNLNPRNPVIGIRSFGDRPDRVSQLGLEFIRGQQEANIATVAKHFPGHGTTDADSHRALPVMRETEPQLLAQMAPFESAVKTGLDGLMTAHVAIPKVTGDEVPATLSPKLLQGLLRKRLGFSGLVLTDELEMEAIAKRYGVGKAAVMALQAGADMVLIPWRKEKKAEVFQALLEAARSGQLPSSRLDEAVRRILALKVRRGVFDEPAPVDERLARLGDQRGVAEQIARQSVTLLRSDGVTLPLRRAQKVGVITAEAALGEAIRQRNPQARVVVVPAYPSLVNRAAYRARAQALAREAEVVVVGVINGAQLELVSAALAARKPVVVVTMGLPYWAEQVAPAKAVLAVYSYRSVSAEAAVAALFGEQGTPGRLPVSLRVYPFGHGLELGAPVGGSSSQSSSR